MKRRIHIFLALLIAALTMAACSDTNILNINGNEDASAEKKITSEISIPIIKFRTLNPILSKDECVYFLDKLVYEPLVGLDETLTPIPCLASSWEYSEDGLTLTLNIRNDVLWHDEKKLTSEDVKFTLDVLMKAQYENQSIYAENVKNIKSVSADDSKVIVKFKSNIDNGIGNFVFPIIPKHQFANINDVFKNASKFMPIGSGPYKVTEFDVVKEVVLTGYENYRGDKKAENTLIFKIIPDMEQAVNLFDINDLMITFYENTDRDKIFGGKDVNIYPYTSNEVEVLGFNFSKPVFRDKRIRQALACAIDGQDIIENAYYNNGIRNDNIYFPNYLGKNSSENLIATNYDKAVKLLAEAGYINRDGDSYVEDANGEEIEIGILINSEDIYRKAAADIIKNCLDKLPIHSYIIVKDWSGYIADLNAGQFDIYIGGWKIETGYDMRFALQTGKNQIRYSNVELDALLDKMESGIDNKTKLETFSRIKEILNDDVPYYCIAYKTYAAVTSKSLQGIVEPYFFDIYRTSEDWEYVY